LQFGYKASAEQFPSDQLLEFSLLAEEAGFDSVAVSDHFQPWRHATGRAPNSLVWLGALAAASSRVRIGTSVLTPTLRYHPAIVAQAFATLAVLAPGRVFMGVGTGEAMNETSATAAPWPPFKERYERLIEAIELCRALWSGERVSFEGSYYQTDRATIYERSEHPVPIYVAASGPRSARMAGRIADGFICTSGKKPELYEELLAAVADGAHKADRNPDEIDRMIEIKVSYHPDIEVARKACNWWGALALTTEEKSGIDDPVELERLADAIADRAQTRFIVSDNADEVIERVRPYVELGFRHLVFHAPEADQPEFLRRFSEEVLPRMRERWPAIQPDLDDRAATLP
jgi:coenzyme F420-dependent glucose-6-phosphate dehydrogenase